MKYSELASIYEALERTSKRLEKTYIISGLLKKTREEDIGRILLLIQGRLFPLWDETKLGVSDRLIIKAISLATGISPVKVEEEWKKLGDLGLVAEKLVQRKRQATLFSKELTVEKVFNNLRRLPALEGPGSVDQKVKVIAELLSCAKPLEARYVVRTVLEDLRVGVGAGSIRDAIVWAFFDKKVRVNYDEKEKTINPDNREEYNRLVEAVQHAFDLKADYGEVARMIMQKGETAFEELVLEPGKPINVMLYQKAKDLKDAFERVGKPCALEYKYDGFRCITGYTSLFVKNKGFVCVRDVREGDYVLTHKGNFKKVLATNKRRIDPGEKLFELTTYYGASFRVSEKHPLLVFRNKPSWVYVEDIKPGDKLVFPIPRLRGKDYLERLRGRLVLSDEAGYSKVLEMNDFFFRFLGYWVGDGFTNNYHNTERIGLIFNYKTQKDLCAFYEENIKKFFGISNIRRNIHNGAIYLYWRDKPFRRWLSCFFRREWKGKTLPEWFSSITEQQFRMFLKGWVESDGYVDEKGRTSIITKEKDLAMFVCLLGLKFKRMIGLKKVRVNGKTYHKLIIPKSGRGFVFSKDGVLINIYSIKELKKRDPRTVLYNLQVKGDESYCTSMAALHNCQIHRQGDEIRIFTRRLDDVTKQFPEVVGYVKKYVRADDFILDSEAVGFDHKTGKYLPFQAISQRIKRKYNIEQMARELPVEVNVFDIMYYKGRSLLKEPFKKRRAVLERIITPCKKKLVLAKQLVTGDLAEAEMFYKEALEVGEEGVMAKNLEGVYKPGSRVGYGVKVKPVMESLDLVIVGAEWGTGKRSGWLTSFVLACRAGNEFVEIGKVGTGIKELEREGVSFKELTKRLKPLIVKEEGKVVRVKPEVIIEVNYEEIQKSPTYASGYALRFPRFVRLRDDKALSDVSSLSLIEDLYKAQK